MRYFLKPFICLLLAAVGFMMFSDIDLQEESPMTKDKAKYPFRCTLETEKEFLTRKPVNLRFSLKNQGARTLYVLTWYTPLEGLAGNIFLITRNGSEEVPYRGILAKRGQPTADDYAIVQPGKVLSAEIDLAQSYNLSKTGHYRVEFKGKLFDVTDKKQFIPRKQAAHESQKITCNAVDFKIVCKQSDD